MKKSQILFLSQGRIGNFVSKFAVYFAQNAKGFDIMYKLHPTEIEGWREKYPGLKESGVTVIEDSTTSTHELFAESYSQVGVLSTVLFEGLAHGLRIFLIELPGVEHMKYLVEKALPQL